MAVIIASGSTLNQYSFISTDQEAETESSRVKESKYTPVACTARPFLIMQTFVILPVQLVTKFLLCPGEAAETKRDSDL